MDTGHDTYIYIYIYRHVDTYNVQNIERSTGVVSVSNTDASRTPDTTRDWSVRAS